MKLSDVIRGFPTEPYGESAEVRYKFPKATAAIIAINVIIYLITTSNHFFLSIDEKWLYSYGFIPLLLLQDPVNTYRIFTSMFLHAGIIHIFFNMYFLYIFGKAVENTIGSIRFLILYFISGIAASIFHTAFSILQGASALAIPAIGASGAISGVLGSYLLLYPGTSLTTCWFFFFVPVCFTMRAAYYLIFWFALQVLYGYARLGASVAFFAHAGGFVAGIALLPLVINKERHYALKIKSSAGSLFDFIVYGLRRFREGLPKGAKLILTALVASLLIGAMFIGYDVATSKGVGLYVANIKVNVPSYGVSYVDTVVLRSEGTTLKPEDIANPTTRVLLNRLLYAGLLCNKNYAGKEINLVNKDLSIELCGVIVPLIIKEFHGIYNKLGILIKGYGDLSSRVVKVYLIGGTCRGELGEWIRYVFSIVVPNQVNIGFNIVILATISVLTSLVALYVITKKDKDIVIVS